MNAKRAFLFAAAALLLGTSFAEARYRSFRQRLFDLRAQYRGHVHIARMNGKPAVFINTDFGQGSYRRWTPAQKRRFQRFQKDLLKTMGTNTLQLWNPVGDDWLRVGTGTGRNQRLAAENKGQKIKLYNRYESNPFIIPEPGTQRSTVMVKLKNPQLSKLNAYLEAIKSDFRGTLGRTDYYGGVPPYVSGRADGAHNCTSWMTSWLEKEVGGGLDYGADPPSWCRATARYSNHIQPVRGVLVFNHPNAPHTGQSIPYNFPLHFE